MRNSPFSIPQRLRASAACFGSLALLLVVPASAEQVTILDMNILSYNSADSDEWDALVRIIEGIDPDVLLFEEAQNPGGRSAFMSHFAARYPYSFLGAPTSDNPRNQVLSAYPLLATGQIFTEDPDGGFFERPTVWADLDVFPLAAGAELRVYATHYKSGSASRDNTLRLNQATDDADHVVALITADPQARVYYAGDLNAEIGDPPLNKLLEPQTTLSRLTIVDPDTGNPMTRPASGKTIDHIFYTATLSGLISNPFIFNSAAPGTNPSPILTGDSALASDHLALIATVDVPGDPPTGDILLNEVYLNDAGDPDSLEFIEIFGPADASLNGLSIVIVEGDGEDNPGSVDRIWSLGGKVVPADQLFVAGDFALSPDMILGVNNLLENGTQTVLLVRNATVTIGQDIDTNNDGVPDVAVGIIEDEVALADAGIAASDRTYLSAPVVGPVLGALPPGAARCPDGGDTDSAADWLVLSIQFNGGDLQPAPSPGTPNHESPADFDADCDVDNDDFGIFQAGLSGADVPTGDPRTDLDVDGDTDLTDFGFFQTLLTGPK